MPSPSFPKRHASFHSPCQVPLPSPSAEQPPPSTSSTSSWQDRFSAASLPCPDHIPYFALPKADLSCPPLDPSSSESSTDSSSSSSSHPPQDPPVAPTPTAMRTRPVSASSSASSSTSSPSLPGYTPASPLPSLPYPSFAALPEAPTILEDEPSSHSPAPYEAFLGGGVGGTNTQTPPDSWIQIESFLGEYRLYVRLPGFTREGITLATKRRRILHLVADRWDRDGGHFERRIAFGHDADLMQVRAEFDGEMLRVFIPRRQPAYSWCGNGGTRGNIAYSRA